MLMRCVRRIHRSAKVRRIIQNKSNVLCRDMALDRYNQAMERLKSGDWTGFGTELGAMRGLLEDLGRQSSGH